MSAMRVVWTLRSHGWALCEVSDGSSSAEVVASYVTDGPEDLLRAVARLLLYEAETSAEFQAEPTVYRWFLRGVGTMSIFGWLRLGM